ncbi:Aste57867_25205 [Aphanomyces stellatus]|uniref:Aste57867_25205 protein n=1 Tax=Aphanomyces stellatus TaxID=120398 RepID=A0A485LTV9_9STRA|nr:hypothetical protein As57867_025127 [Aphanomyces stellatus]VFU01832.1 Aste57867_25205 [Aphanomyces stellatus]
MGLKSSAPVKQLTPIRPSSPDHAFAIVPSSKSVSPSSASPSATATRAVKQVTPPSYDSPTVYTCRASLVEPPSRRDRLAACAPLLSQVRAWLFVAGHGVHWPHTAFALVNLAAEVPFPEENSPPPHIDRILTLALRDGPTQEFLPFLPRVLAVIDGRAAVIMLCQQGVSRSCAMAIAVLMCREGLPYPAVFAQMKAARDICSPNSGFLCQLMELTAQRADAAKRPCVYRYEPHAAHDATTYVLKSCLHPTTRTQATPRQVCRHPHGVYLYMAPTTVYIWSGRQVNAELGAAADMELRQWYQYVWQEAMPPVSMIQQGNEPAEFLAWVNSQDVAKDADEGPVDYGDSEWPKSQTPPRPSETAPKPLHDDVAIASPKPQFRVITAADDSWEWLREYDSGDLVSDQVGWLHVPGVCDYVWLGTNHDAAWTNNAIAAKMRAESSPVVTAKIVFVAEMAEPEAFWEMFEAGY